MLPFLHHIEEMMGGLKGTSGVRVEPWPILILGLVLLVVSFVFMPAAVSVALSLALFLAPVWLPLLILGGAFTLWRILKQGEFIETQSYILLEIKPPRNLVKTPLAMETFLSAIHLGPGESTWYVRWFKGSVRPWWSLEIASFEGQVHFFIWTRANYRRIIESQMYAQYPGVQLVDAPDYTRLISAKPEEWSIWGCDYKHTAEDPLPIKTYVEYGLDKVQKEPEQVDPIANLIEFMHSLGKGEYLWLQLIVRVHKGEKYGKLNEKGKPYTWKDEAKEMVAKIREETRSTYTDPTTGEEVPGFPNPTKGQSEKMAAIERNVSKLAFDVGARAVYVAKPEHFKAVTITQMIGLFKVFNTEGWNGIRATGWMTEFDDYPWEVGADKLKNVYREGIVQAFRRRQFFYEPFATTGESMVMSTEELATIYHVPSGGVETPGLKRIQSATGDAPANLPI